jgi:acyl carrier protein
MTETTIEQKRAALLEQRLRQRQAAQAGHDRIAPVPRTGPLRLSRQQEGLWLSAQLAPQLSTYNMPLTMRLTGPLDAGLLRAALGALTARHESLRTSFTTREGVPYLVVAEPPGEIWLEQTDLTAIPEDVRAQYALSLAAAQASRAFDLRRPPLLRAWLARLGPEDHLFQLTPHHIVCDGWSLPILTRELTELYNAALAGRPAQLPDLPLQPIDVDAWQRGQLAAGLLDQRLDYWRGQLAGLPRLNYPTDRPRPANPTLDGRHTTVDLPAELIDRADAEALRTQVAPFAVLLAAFATVLRDRTGQDDLALGSVFSGRTRTEMEPLVGFFASTQVLRVRLEPGLSARALIDQCHRTVLDAQKRQDVPFTDVVDAVQPERTPGVNPLFQICFTVARAGVTGVPVAFAGVTAEPLQIHQTGSRFDLVFQVTEKAGRRFAVQMEYSTELFDLGSVERLVADFRDALDRLLSVEDWAVTEVPAAPANVGVPQSDPADADADPDARPDPLDGAARSALIRQELAGIWAEVFEVESGPLSGEESFFEIGGTSIKAVRLRSRIQESFGVDIGLADLFAGGSIAELTEAIDAALDGPPPRPAR